VRIHHTFASAKSDGGDATLVRPSNWNDGHFRQPDSQGGLYLPFDTTDTSDPVVGLTMLGSPDVFDSNSTAKSHLTVKETGSGAVNVVGGYMSWSPSAGQYVETWLTDAVLSASLSSYVGVFCGEAGGTGKLLLAGIGRYATAWDDKLVAFSYTNRTTFSGETSVTGPWRTPLGIRLVFNSSTSYDVLLSHGGVGWRKLIAGHNPGFTPAIAGLGGDMSANGFQTEAYFDYLNNG
jgi:hypothetical protein